MDDYFIDNLQDADFEALLSLSTSVVIMGFIVSMVVAFVAWGVWAVFRMFYNIAK